MRGEDAQVAHFFGDDVAAAVRDEEAGSPLRRDAVEESFGITRRPGDSQGAFVDIGGENLHAGCGGKCSHIFAQQNGDRENFFAGGAAWHPDAHRVIGATPFKQAGDHQLQSASNASGSRKKLVTLMRRSRKSAPTSCGSWRSSSTYASMVLSWRTCMRRCTRRRKVFCL